MVSKIVLTLHWSYFKVEQNVISDLLVCKNSPRLGNCTGRKSAGKAKIHFPCIQEIVIQTRKTKSKQSEHEKNKDHRKRSVKTTEAYSISDTLIERGLIQKVR